MKTANVKEGDFVEVTWIDSTTWRGWQTIPGIKHQRPVDIVSIGMVVCSNNTFITLGSHICHADNDMCEAMSIPIGCIMKLRKVRLVDLKKRKKK